MFLLGVGSWLKQFVVLPYTTFLPFIAEQLLEDYFWFGFNTGVFLSSIYICQQQHFPLSVIMALANKKLAEANKKQNLQLRRGNNVKNY